MSSGIEVVALFPILIPGLAGNAITGAVSSLALGSAAVGASGGAVAVSASSVVTTSAFASGGITAASGGAAGMAGAAALGGAVTVFGAAGAALLAAQHLHGHYVTALGEYQSRIDQESAETRTSAGVRRDAMNLAVLSARKTRIQAAESAEITFLNLGIRSLQKQLGTDPQVDPRLPGGCITLLQALQAPEPDLDQIFAAYMELCGLVSAWSSQKRREIMDRLGKVQTSSLDEALKISIASQIEVLRKDVTGAPAGILNESVQRELRNQLLRLEQLAQTQPQMAEQGVELLCRRIRREVSTGRARLADERGRQEEFSGRVRALAGRISARSQAALDVLQDQELQNSSLARSQLAPLQAEAMQRLQKLSLLLAGDLPHDLKPLEVLALEADSHFEKTADQLRQIALQIYLESQVTEIFTQLGYRVTSVDGPGHAVVIAALDSERGVEVRMDGQGNLHSELVAFSGLSSAIEPHAQQKVCDVMDEVFELLRARGCGIKEKKRRHFKMGEKSLRVVEARPRKDDQVQQVQSPALRRQGEY